MAVTTTRVAPDQDLRTDLLSAARTLASVTLVGALSGIFAVGVLARLAMMLLAAMNPAAHGVTSDDGFEIGQLTLSGSLQLLLAGLQLGVVGAAAYVAVRGLLIGPPWFRLLSISLGPAVVVGAIIVHTDGVDFTLLDPPVLAAGLFVAVPAVYVALLHLGAERALRSDRALPRPLLALGLLPWIPLFPVTLVLAAGFLLLRWLRARPRGAAYLESPGPSWVLRGLLAAVFVVAVLDLRADLALLTWEPPGG